MNIKRLDPYKKVFEYFINTLPLDAMEFDIQQSSDPLIKRLYNSILYVDHNTNHLRYRPIYHKIGILGTYTLYDVVYGDYIRWILSRIEGQDLQAKEPEKWRANNL